MEQQDVTQVSLEEAVKLGAVDGGFFGRFFFPRAFKQAPPPFHVELDEYLDDPDSPFVSAMVFRGGAKTTKLRVYAARRIAYGISRTIMIVGKSQKAAMKSVEWLKNAIEFNQRFAATFGLKPGNKWTGEDIEVLHTQFKDENGSPLRIRILAYGMTGSIRGVNIEDCRPDLIIVDDPCDEENTGSTDAREKTAALFFGALKNSLAPQSECPLAKMVLLQTVLNDEDLVSLCDRDPTWRSLRLSIFDEEGKSRWPERWSTEHLRADKDAYIQRRQLSLWMREMECRCVSDEGRAFGENQLRYWNMPDSDGIGGSLPPGGLTFLSIDPVPPPKNAQEVQPKPRHDNAVVSVQRIAGGRIYLCEFWGKKQVDPGELIYMIFDMARRWKCRRIVVETILFARVLKWALEQEMIRRKQFFEVIPIEDKRSKQIRIRQEISAYASQGQLYCSTEHYEFLGEFSQYPDVSHDDYLDAVAIGLMSINPWMLEATENVLEGEFEEVVEEEFKKIENWRADV